MWINSSSFVKVLPIKYKVIFFTMIFFQPSFGFYLWFLLLLLTVAWSFCRFAREMIWFDRVMIFFFFLLLYLFVHFSMAGSLIGSNESVTFLWNCFYLKVHMSNVFFFLNNVKWSKFVFGCIYNAELWNSIHKMSVSREKKKFEPEWSLEYKNHINFTSKKYKN